MASKEYVFSGESHNAGFGLLWLCKQTLLSALILYTTLFVLKTKTFTVINVVGLICINAAFLFECGLEGMK